MHNGVRNPFTFGDLALDEAFTDREEELSELASDLFNGQNVLVYAPRRYGKSSLVLRAAQHALAERALVAYCDLMKTPSKERFAAALAKTIYTDLASPIGQAFERAADLFRGLRISPTMEVDPTDGSLRFSFQPGRRRSDIDDTIERLLELPGELAAERKRPVAIIFDEFQEVVTLDPGFPNLMRAVFQTQPEVSHVYLGSKRHVLERIFNDRNEPFWRSAKQLELGPIPAAKFVPFIRQRFTATGKTITHDAAERLVHASGGHPYGTQELAYFLWELIPAGAEANLAQLDTALDRVLRSENNHLTQIWDESPPSQRVLMLALADEPTPSPYSAAYRERHEVGGTPTLQRALEGLIRREVAARGHDGSYRIVEPFLSEWLTREQRRDGLVPPSA